ncbi:MAG: PAS domain S-box protein [Gammaproteobacteria bacterium]|nr:MAG: PAS domain S-box protein [Gammaproteobacteria bacterium]
MNIASDATALLPALTEPLEARAHFGQVEALFRNTVEHAPVGIAFANPDGGFRHCNRAFCAMLGFSVEELSRKSIASLTLTEDRESTIAGHARLWRGDIAYLDVEKRYVRKDGSALWVRVSTSLVRDGGPEPVCSVEFLRDISARKEMAAALLQNQTLLATVIAELPLALLACDVTGRVTHYNRAAVELFGIPTEDTTALPRSAYPVTSHVYQLDGTTPVPPEDRPLARALRGDNVSDAEFVVATPTGAVRTALSSARRLVGPAGQALGALAVVQDITERRLAEQELENVHKQLLVASRQAGMAEVATNVLHNVGNVLNSVNVSASLVTERIAKSKCTRLGQLTALLTEHAGDLAGFLAGAQGKHLPGYLHELAGTLVNERDTATAELDALRGNIEHIKEIVAMQQNYARRGGIIETLDIRELVEDSLRMNEGAFSRHGVTIIRDYQDVPPIQVDKHKVLQILVNVIRNAKYACQEGEKKVTVRIRPTGAAVLIAVIDTGVGIPRENLDRIFSHGFTTRPDGHGFGLHSSALAAKVLGGSLHAQSTGPGQGATFTLTLPLASPESADVR